MPMLVCVCVHVCLCYWILCAEEKLTCFQFVETGIESMQLTTNQMYQLQPKNLPSQNNHFPLHVWDPWQEQYSPLAKTTWVDFCPLTWRAVTSGSVTVEMLRCLVNAPPLRSHDVRDAFGVHQMKGLFQTEPIGQTSSNYQHPHRNANILKSRMHK